MYIYIYDRSVFTLGRCLSVSHDPFLDLKCCFFPRRISSSRTLTRTLCVSFSLQLSVDTMQFLLFLYIQQLNHVSLRTSLIGEEWPSRRTRCPSPSDREAKTSSQNKVLVTVTGKKPHCMLLICLLPMWWCDARTLSRLMSSLNFIAMSHL